MAHRTIKSSYDQLVKRINKFPQGAPASRHLNNILKILFTEKEAGLVAQLPLKPFSVRRAALVWKKSEAEAQNILESLASRALLVDIDFNGRTKYVLPPPMAGFFEFSMMRYRDDIDQETLGKLFYQYLNEEEDFVKALFTEGETQLGRVFVNEGVLSNENALHVLDYERATEVIETSSHMAVGTCYCRHKMMHVGKECDAPMDDICMTFNTSAAALIKHGHARQVDKVEGRELLAKAYEHDLVQFGENVQKRVNFICNCCGCCCEAMIVARKFALMDPVHTTNFMPVVHADDCSGCGKCVSVCPVEAVVMTNPIDPKNRKRKIAKVDEERCLGCGLCVRACSKGHMHLESRKERVLTPINGTHRAVLMAIERGKLQNLIFDNQVLFSHRALAAVLGAIFRMPPIKQAMANKQLQSRYVNALMKRVKN
jgi:ferredoxin